MIWVCIVQDKHPTSLIFDRLPTFEQFKEKATNRKIELPESFEQNYFVPWIMALKKCISPEEMKPYSPDFHPHCAFKIEDGRFFIMEGHLSL